MNPFHFTSFHLCNHSHSVRTGDTTQTEGGWLRCVPWGLLAAPLSPGPGCAVFMQLSVRPESPPPHLGVPPAPTIAKGPVASRGPCSILITEAIPLSKTLPESIWDVMKTDTAHKPSWRVMCPTLCQAVQQPVTCDIFLWAKEATCKQNHHPCKIGGGWFAARDLLRVLVLPGRLQVPNPSHQIIPNIGGIWPPDYLWAQDPCDKSNFYVNQVLRRLQEGSHRLLQDCRIR